MKRDATSAAAYAMILLAIGLVAFTRPLEPVPVQPREPLGPGSRSAKASDRSGDASDPRREFHSTAATEAELSIRRWLDSLAEHPENLQNPPLDACASLSVRAAENFLRDPDHGWSPLLDVSRYAFLTNWEAMLPFHEALLARWAELDPDALLLKLPPPDSQDKAMAPATALMEKAIESIDGNGAGRLLQHWSERMGEKMGNPSPAYRNAMEKLMQAWSGTDPKASWEWLKEASVTGGSEWQYASRGYLLGLENPDWRALLEEAKALPDSSLFAGQSTQSYFRLEVIRLWGMEDPSGALSVIEAPPISIFGGSDIQTVAEANQAWGPLRIQLITEWLEKNPQAAGQFASWQPSGMNRDSTFAGIAMDTRNSNEVRRAAYGLIRDTKRREKIIEYFNTEQRLGGINFDGVEGEVVEAGEPIMPEYESLDE